jgi:hypothetical protein
MPYSRDLRLGSDTEVLGALTELSVETKAVADEGFCWPSFFGRIKSSLGALCHIWLLYNDLETEAESRTTLE